MHQGRVHAGMPSQLPCRQVAETLLPDVQLLLEQSLRHNGAYHPLLHKGILSTCYQHQNPVVIVGGRS